MPVPRPITRRRLALTLLGAAALPAAARADIDRVYTGLLSDLAAGGHDVVAYVTEGRAVEGRRAHAVEHRGARWLFANAGNAARFAAEPEAYAPQYGGHCAWAVANGYTAKGDPAHWRIVDGRLYLAYNAAVLARWERDIAGHIEAGDRNWPTLLAE